MSADEFFERGWPSLVPQLRTMLAWAGTPVADREDVVQETAVRLFGSGIGSIRTVRSYLWRGGSR